MRFLKPRWPKVLANVPLDQETKAVLLGGTGRLRPLYQLMLAREWPETGRTPPELAETSSAPAAKARSPKPTGRAMQWARHRECWLSPPARKNSAGISNSWLTSHDPRLAITSVQNYPSLALRSPACKGRYHSDVFPAATLPSGPSAPNWLQAPNGQRTFSPVNFQPHWFLLARLCLCATCRHHPANAVRGKTTRIRPSGGLNAEDKTRKI